MCIRDSIDTGHASFRQKLIHTVFNDVFFDTGRYCGSGRVYEPVVSTGSRMLITYITSGASTEHRGFIANFEGR